MKRPEKYVVLEHLTLPDRGLRFWSMNTEDNTHSAWGDLWYKEILFTDSEDEAIEASQKMGELPTMHELEEYYNNKLYEQEQEKQGNN
jgi:hypothetical protein